MTVSLPSPRTRVLVALCIVLAAAVGFSLFRPLGGARVLTPVQPVPGVTADLATLNGTKSALPGLESLSETRARPVFIATRRAAQTSPRIGTGSQEGLILGRYRLRGVVITPNRRSVVVQPARGGKTTELRVGSKIDGWVVDEIAPEFMKLKSGGLVETISLVPKGRGKPRK